MNKKFLFIGIALVLLLLVGGGVFFLASHNAAQPTDSTSDGTQDVLPTLTPDQIGLNVTVTDDKKKVKFVINKPEAIQKVDYELTYKATDDQERGVIGSIDVKPEDSTIESKDLDLGSCSKNVCKYDTNIHDMQLSLKITKADGKEYQTVKNISL